MPRLVKLEQVPVIDAEYLNDIEDKYRNRIEKMGNLIQFLMDYIRFLNYKHYKELTEEKNKINYNTSLRDF
tara:strand:+ start:100 stop:312 length:213 start_codon:yes stop_codon:yes gene_type:complete